MEEGKATAQLELEPMVTLDEAARPFSVSVGFLRKQIRRRKVRCHRLGVKLLRLRLSEVLEDLEKMRRPGRPRKD